MMENKSGLEPLGKAVLVQTYELEDTTKSGIILAPATREREALAEQRAVVVAVGPEAWSDERKPRARPGDKVMVTKYAGYVAVGPLDGGKYRVVSDIDIFLGITAEKSHE